MILSPGVVPGLASLLLCMFCVKQGPPPFPAVTCNGASYFWSTQAAVCIAGGTARPFSLYSLRALLVTQERSRTVSRPGMAVPRVQARWSVRTEALWHQGSQ